MHSPQGSPCRPRSDTRSRFHPFPPANAPATSLPSPTAQQAPPPFPPSPARKEPAPRGAVLPREIAARRGAVSAAPAELPPPQSPGELVVIGSGIEAVGFTAADEM